MRLVIPCLIAALLLAAVPSVALAQYFPARGTLPEMEAEAQTLIEAHQRQLEAQRLAELRKTENDARWREISKASKDKLKEVQRAANGRDVRQLMSDLANRKSNFVLGALYYNLGAWSSASSTFKKCQRDDAPQWQAAATIMLARQDLIDVFDDVDPSRYESRLPKEIEKTRERLDATLQKIGADKAQVQRTFDIGDVDAWLNSLPDLLKREQDLLKQIEQNTWDGDAMWALARLYRHNLMLLHRARVWCEIMKEHSSKSQAVISGEVDAMIADVMIRQGFIDEGSAHMDKAQGEINTSLMAVENRLKQLEQKLAEANKRGEKPELSPEEQELSKIDVQRIRKEAKQRADETNKHLRNVARVIHEAAGRRERDR